MNGTEIITFLANNAPVIISATSPFVGAILTAVFLRSNTSTKEFEKVKAGKFDEVVEDLLESGQMTYTEFYKANNFLKIAKKADAYHAEKNQIISYNTKTYDFDWFIRYYEASGNVSDEKMQDIWSKVLAGEIDNPSSFSLRTIDILKNMRKTDAELFAKFCECSFMRYNGQMFLPNYDEYLEENEIEYSDVMQLNEMGLIFSDASISITYEQIQVKPQVLFVNKELIMTVAAKDEKNRNFHIKQFPYTKVGNELATLVSNSASDESFISFGREIAKNTSFNISVHKIIWHNGSEIRHENKNLIE